MTAILASLLASLAEAWLSRRLNGVRVKIDREGLRQVLDNGLHAFDSSPPAIRLWDRAYTLAEREKAILARLKAIRPVPTVDSFAVDENGNLGLITREGDSGDWFGIQLGNEGKSAGGPWHSFEPVVVGHLSGLVKKKNEKVTFRD